MIWSASMMYQKANISAVVKLNSHFCFGLIAKEIQFSELFPWLHIIFFMLTEPRWSNGDFVGSSCHQCKNTAESIPILQAFNISWVSKYWASVLIRWSVICQSEQVVKSSWMLTLHCHFELVVLGSSPPPEVLLAMKVLRMTKYPIQIHYIWFAIPCLSKNTIDCSQTTNSLVLKIDG